MESNLKYASFALRTGLTLIFVVALSACSSLRGAPEPIIGLSDNLQMVKSEKMDKAIEHFNSNNDSDRHGMSKRAYRDMVITIYLNGVDAQYQQFRTEIASESRGAGFGVDLAILGLTGGASFAGQEVANRLSAVASAFAGAKGSLDKHFYFEKTLPALLAAMDASRTRVRTTIVENMRKDEGAYPLTSAFADINSYQMAATLDHAIEQITSAAASDRQNAIVALDTAIKACDGAEDMLDAYSSFRKPMLALDLTADVGKSTLNVIAEAAGVAKNAIPATTFRDVILKLRTDHCSVESVEKLKATVNEKMGRSFFQ
jgi:hypothetical protein